MNDRKVVDYARRVFRGYRHFLGRYLEIRLCY
jgi:hypothetical protein